MKRKIIKKIFRFFLWFLGTLLFLFILLYFAFRSPAFQTWAANRIGGYFSGKWNTVVRVDGIDVELWKKIVLEGVYVEDQHRDTLLYAEKLKLDIGTFDTDSQIVFLSDVILKNATVKLKQYLGEPDLNFQFIIDEFASTDTTPSADTTAWSIGAEAITLDNIRFAYRLEKDTSVMKGINFSDLLANSVSASITNLNFDADTIHARIENISLEEKSGFRLKEFQADASISPVHLKLNQAKIFTNSSQVIANLLFRYNTYDDFNDFVNQVRIKAQFNSSNIEMADIAYFTDELYGIKKRVFLNGDVSGKVNDLRGRNILLVIGDETSYMGNFTMTGLPDFNQTFMSFDAKELRTSKEGIEKIPIPPFDKQKGIELPDNVSLFGIIKFKGNFSGFYNDFVAYGNFNTALGSISTDISMKEDTLINLPRYKGKFACTDFNLGKFFESEEFIGRISMNVNVDGKGLSKEKTTLTMDGSATHLELKGYGYKNIEVKGKFAKNIFDGTLSVNDENLVLDFSGNMDFSKRPTVMNFASTVTKANLNKLNLMKPDEYSGLTAKIKVNAVGNNLDDVIGQVILDDVVYLKGHEVFNFEDVELLVEEKAGLKTVELSSDIADAKVHGRFKPLEMAPSLLDFMGDYLPSVFAKQDEKGAQLAAGKPVKKDIKGKSFSDDFTYSFNLKRPDTVTRAFLPSLSIAPQTLINGKYDSEKNLFSFFASSSRISVRGTKFSGCRVNAETEDNRVALAVSVQRVSFSDSVWLDSVKLNSGIAMDTVNFRLKWNNNTAQTYRANIPGYISFSEKPKVKFKLLPSTIIIADSVWALNKGNEIVMDSTFIAVRDMGFESGRQQVRIEGNISEVKEDQIYLMLSSFSLANFNTALKGSGFSVFGTISGNTSIGNLYDKPVFGSSLDIRNLKLNNELIGSGNLASVYDSKRSRINFNGNFVRDDAGRVVFSGNYFPYKKDSSLNAELEVRDFHLAFFNPFLKGNVENIRGSAGAELKVVGTPQRPQVEGTISADVANAHIVYLGTDYNFSGNIAVKPGAFEFAGLTVYDANKNRAEVVNGKLFHDNFKNFQLDFDLNANKFLCLNTNEKDNPTYYGKVFATGIINVFGYTDNINLSASVKTDKAKNSLGKNEYTQLFIPLSGSEEVSETGFISFVKSDAQLQSKPPKYKVKTTGFTMNLKVEATPDAQVQLIFDEKVGDVIRASGNGDIEMAVNEFGDFKMFGDYTVEDGDYLFTLKNIVNKKFRLENGGTIHWSGNPEEAEIKMSAIYELRTSLSPLFPQHEGEIDQERYDALKKRYPVDCVMNLSGKLLEPDITFDVRLPTVDDFTRQQAYDKFKHSELEVNRQVFSLLFTNSFSVPPDIRGSAAADGPGAGTVTSTEVLSNQLSNWLSQISTQFDVGVHYRPGGNTELSKDEVELALSTQLFNDKMSIDGSVANNPNNTNQNAASIVGDINVDYKLTEDGKLRAKAYNKANEGDVLNAQKGQYTQGVGIFYREEFETVKELYLRFIGRFKKKNGNSTS